MRQTAVSLSPSPRRSCASCEDTRTRRMPWLTPIQFDVRAGGQISSLFPLRLKFSCPSLPHVISSSSPGQAGFLPVYWRGTGKHPSSEASSLYCTLATMREHHSQAYVGLFKTPRAEKSLCELLDTHLENVQLALSQRDACDGVSPAGGRSVSRWSGRWLRVRGHETIPVLFGDCPINDKCLPCGVCHWSLRSMLGSPCTELRQVLPRHVHSYFGASRGLAH